MANTWPGDWMFANSIFLSREKFGPVNSLTASLRAKCAYVMLRQ